LGANTFIKRVRNKILSCGITRWANCNVAVSTQAARYAFGKYNSNVHVINNGVYVSRFKYNPNVRKKVRKELGIEDNVLCIGNVGRLEKEKNHIFLLDVFNEICKRTNCMLLLVGKGALENEILDKVNAMGLSSSVKLLGSRHDVDKLYQAFDVFLFPPLFEGFGLAAVEAQCAGLPCVVSEHVPAVVKCSDQIKFLPLGNSVLWAEAAIDLASKPRYDGCENVKAAGLDAETMCGNVLHLYQSVLEAGNVK
jgi:glycosyltransferase involved in cell wall biosynthesis